MCIGRLANWRVLNIADPWGDNSEERKTVGISHDGFRTLEALTKLQKLDASYRKLDNGALRSLLASKILIDVDLSHTGLGAKGLEALSTAPQLESINWCGNQVKGSALDHLTGLSRLRDLNLASTKIGSHELKLVGKIVSLQRLDLFETNVGDDGVSSLQKPSNLRELNFDSTLVTKAAAQRLQQKLPHCKISGGMGKNFGGWQ